MDVEGQCMVCGDRSAGKHYGVMACYGCKGFFRRTIRSGQTYTCRFGQKCSIDRDQRNACRFCRFQRCLNVGMEPDAIRPDRDVIGKQKNPRRKKLKREDSSLPSPGEEDSHHDDALLTFLIDVELQVCEGSTRQVNNGMTNNSSGIGIARIKDDPDFDISSLFTNKASYAHENFEMAYAAGRVATVEQFTAAMRRYVSACAQWIDALFGLVNLDDTKEKLAVLKSVFAAFCLHSQAARTVQSAPRDADCICLCNQSTIPRVPPRHLIETNLLSNNIIPRLIDDLVGPMQKLSMNEAEIVALTALIILDSDAPGLSHTTSRIVAELRDRVQTALFQVVRDRSSIGDSAVCSRFGNILLLLPPLAKLSSLVGENVQFAKMFGNQSLDPLLVELFVDNPGEVIPSPTNKDRTDMWTQTRSPSLPSDLAEVLGEEQTSLLVANAASLVNPPQTTNLENVAPIVPTRPAPLVVPSYNHPFYFPTPTTQSTFLPQSAPYYNPHTFFDNGSQSAPDPSRTFRFM